MAVDVMPFPTNNSTTLSTNLSLTPTHLDFGLLRRNSKQTQTFCVEYQDANIDSFGIQQSEENTWFRVINVKRRHDNQSFPLEIKIVVNTELLEPGRSYFGWVAVNVNNEMARVPFKVAIMDEALANHRVWLPIPVFLRPFILLCMAILVLYFTAQFALQTPLSIQSELAPQLQPHKVSFSIYENGHYTLYTSNSDGLNQQSLEIPGWSPTGSPDGKQLAFISSQKGGLQLYALNLEDRVFSRLTDTPGAKIRPVWSPDSRLLAFITQEPGMNRLEIVDTIPFLSEDGTDAGQTTFQENLDRVNSMISEITNQSQPAALGGTTQFSWAPDNQSLLFDLYNGEQRNIYHVDADSVEIFIEDSWEPSWSPDGTQVAAVSSAGIFIADHQGQNRRHLTTFPAWAPKWSFDGKRLAFLSDYNSPDGEINLWLMDSNGENLTRLTAHGCRFFAWSPHNESLAYITGNTDERKPARYLWVMTSAIQSQLIAEVSELYIAWMY